MTQVGSQQWACLFIFIKTSRFLQRHPQVLMNDQQAEILSLSLTPPRLLCELSVTGQIQKAER